MSTIRFSFRDPDKSPEYHILHPKLQDIFQILCQSLNIAGFDVEITSMIRMPGQISGESGVHATGRAMDCIPKQAITEMQARDFEDGINLLFPRKDKYDTCMWHKASGGGGYHFHLQVEQSQNYIDLKGFVPKLQVGQ